MTRMSSGPAAAFCATPPTVISSGALLLWRSSTIAPFVLSRRCSLVRSCNSLRNGRRPGPLHAELNSREPSDDQDDQEFLQGELSRLNSLEELLADLEEGGDVDGKILDLQQMMDDEGYLDEETWIDLFGSLPDDVDPEELAKMEMMSSQVSEELDEKKQEQQAKNVKVAIPTESLESALMQGVVPADAGVGSGSLPGDYGFDPLDLASKDIIGKVQRWVWNLLPGDDEEEHSFEERPQALVLRDYREAEIRHGRLAMLAAILWPLQEMLDRLLLDEDQFGSTTIVYGGVTLPYLSLLMTAIMLLLGYLDIYANAIKEVDAVGEAWSPGDNYWDPLRMLDGATSTMKRNMQERELLNGRAAMLAFAVFVFEEATTHQPLITIPGNELLFEPAYQVPYIQEWLDSVFATASPTFTLPNEGAVDFTEAAKEVLKEEEGVSPF